MTRELLRDWRLLQNSSCRNARRQVKNDLVLGAFRWPVFTRPSLAAFHLTAEDQRLAHMRSVCGGVLFQTWLQGFLYASSFRMNTGACNHKDLDSRADGALPLHGRC